MVWYSSEHKFINRSLGGIGGRMITETLEARHIRWRSEALRHREQLWPWQQAALFLTGQTRVCREQLRDKFDDELKAPLTKMYLVTCPAPACQKLGKDYKHGFPENGRYFSCNSCHERFDAREWISSTLQAAATLASLVTLAWRYRGMKKLPSQT